MGQVQAGMFDAAPDLQAFGCSRFTTPDLEVTLQDWQVLLKVCINMYWDAHCLRSSVMHGQLLQLNLPHRARSALLRSTWTLASLQQLSIACDLLTPN